MSSSDEMTRSTLRVRRLAPLLVQPPLHAA